jgi:hypothetical protein
MPIPFEEKTVKYYYETDDPLQPRMYGVTNPETWHFMEHRYVVLRDFIPKEIRQFALDCWKTIEAQPDNFQAGLKREGDIINKSPTDTLGKSIGGHSSPMAVAMGRWLCEALDNVLDIPLRETYTYSRKYDRGAYLKAHVDRPSCEVSATYCLDYLSDDTTPWKIWVQNDQNYVGWPCMDDVFQRSQAEPPRRRIAKALTLHPGDVLIYQGPNVIHFRDKFVGDYTYHMFSHFHNLNGGLRNYCMSKGLFYNKAAPNTPNTDVQITPLEFDARRDRYSESGSDEILSMMMDEFNQNYEQESQEHKQAIVNNFSDLIRVEEK